MISKNSPYENQFMKYCWLPVRMLILSTTPAKRELRKTTKTGEYYSKLACGGNIEC